MNSEIDIIGIPNSAFWAGNDKRGNWFNVEDINREKNMTTISIYDDNTGELILENTFMKICHEDNLHFIENLKDEIAYYDGHKIILNDSCYLMENNNCHQHNLGKMAVLRYNLSFPFKFASHLLFLIKI